MTETVSVPVDLIPTPLFRKKYNIKYSDSDFDGTAKWQIVVSNNCPDNLEDCLDSDGLLSGVTESATVDVALSLIETSSVGGYVKITSNVTMTLTGDVDVKGVFLRKKSSTANQKFVLMGMVNQKPMRFCDGITFEAGNVLFVLEG